MDAVECSIKIKSIATTDLSKCILCQKDKKENLTSTENGRCKLQTASKVIQDGLLSHFEEGRLSDIKYHLVCFKPYMLRSERSQNRHEPTAGSSIVDPVTNIDDTLTSPKTKKKRESQDGSVCIICSKPRFKGDANLYRICEASRAKVFLSAIQYNMDDVYTKCSIYKTKEHIFAADIVSHKGCMKRYLIQYQRKMEEIMRCDCSTDNDSNIIEVFNSVISKMELVHNAYTISTCRDMINSKLIGEDIDNRKVKTLLIQQFGEDICFTYPRDQSISQGFFLRTIGTSDVVETIRNSNPIKECAEVLKEECRGYDFGLDESFCNASDLKNSNERDRPKYWVQFLNILFPNRHESKSIKRKCDTIFQSVYYLIHNGKKKTPMHVSIASAVHDLTRSKQLIRIFNCLGLGISYDELERIDCALARRTIDRAGNHRVPIPPSIKGNDVIHGAMDNFDHEENSKSGKGGSHDTILVLFENNTQQNTFEEEYVVNKNDFEDQRSLNHILECQKLIRGHKFGVRGEIPINYETGTPLNTIDVENEADKRFRTWLLARSLKDGYTQNVPSFAAMNSLLFSGHHFLTEICFTPIVPYTATDYDTIFTCMKNFQDVLEQKSQKYGPL